MIDHYDWAGGREAMLRFGPADGPVVVVAMPLLEEWNRTRAFVVTILRRLAERGIASAVPDLPAQGESLVATADVRLEHWQDAFAAACVAAADDGAPYATISIRGGALVEQSAPVRARWRLSPLTGHELVGELGRLAQLADDMRHPENTSLRRLGMSSLVPCIGEMRDVAGNCVHGELLDALAEVDEVLQQGSVRIVRLESDPRPADRKLPGRPLWRASEPDIDEALVRTITDDIQDWLTTCAA